MNECEAFGLGYGLGIPLLCICILCVTKRRGTKDLCVGDGNRLPVFGMLVILTGVSLFAARLRGATAAGLEIAGGVLCCVGLMLVVVGWQRVRAEKARGARALEEDDKLCAELASRAGEMTIFVATLGGTKVAVEVDKADTIETVKRKLRGKGEVDHRRQRLMLNQLELTQGTVASNAIEPNATLHLIVAGGTDQMASQVPQQPAVVIGGAAPQSGIVMGRVVPGSVVQGSFVQGSVGQGSVVQGSLVAPDRDLFRQE